MFLCLQFHVDWSLGEGGGGSSLAMERISNELQIILIPDPELHGPTLILGSGFHEMQDLFL